MMYVSQNVDVRNEQVPKCSSVVNGTVTECIMHNGNVQDVMLPNF